MLPSEPSDPPPTGVPPAHAAQGGGKAPASPQGCSFSAGDVEKWKSLGCSAHAWVLGGISGAQQLQAPSAHLKLRVVESFGWEGV